MINYILIASLMASPQETKFHFGDKVKVIHGFYKGCIGVVNSVEIDQFHKSDNQYNVINANCRESEIDFTAEEKNLRGVK